MDEKTLAVAVPFAGLCLMGLGMLVLFGGGPPPAPERPRPATAAEAPLGAVIRYSPTIYQGLLDQDAKSYDAPPISAAQIAAPNPYFEEWKGPRRLKGSATIETPHLKLSVVVSKEQGASVAGQTFKADHLVLRIENKTPVYLAYRVQTAVSNENKCAAKGDLPQNAVVIAPRETILRTECLYRTDEKVDVTRVEVIELPPLSAYYVSRLPPTLVLYDPRTSGGHVVPKGRPCAQTFSWRDIRNGDARGELGWRDVIDFYARHNCDEYTFFKSYRYRTSATDPPLPVRPPPGG